MENADIVRAVRGFALATADATGLLTAVVRLLRGAREHFHWVGVYLLVGDELRLGRYEGKPTPHSRIPLSQRICGAAASTGQTVIVDDVNADPRYLACSLETRSEIVVPIIREGRVLGEIDIDSDRPAAFDSQDHELLESVAEILASKL